MILVAGGIEDPNIQALLAAADQLGVATLPVLIGKQQRPIISWDLQANLLDINRAGVNATAVFIRRDVFHDNSFDSNYRSLSWYNTINGWLAANRDIRMLNRNALNYYTNKLATLLVAQSLGLTIPKSYASNDIDLLKSQQESIAKPVSGGGYCQSLTDLIDNVEVDDGACASPAIVQSLLPGPDVRIYGIGNTFIGFRIHSHELDYRDKKDYEIEYLKALPEEIISCLAALMDRMSLNWAAADFKESPESGELIFLEINSQPMFSVFDRFAEGRIVNAILNYLIIN